MELRRSIVMSSFCTQLCNSLACGVGKLNASLHPSALGRAGSLPCEPRDDQQRAGGTMRPGCRCRIFCPKRLRSKGLCVCRVVFRKAMTCDAAGNSLGTALSSDSSRAITEMCKRESRTILERAAKLLIAHKERSHATGMGTCSLGNLKVWRPKCLFGCARLLRTRRCRGVCP